MVILVMGPSGSGKSALGEALAARLPAAFFEADEFCPAEAREKMVRGTPLQDEDRWPWLRRLNLEVRNAAGEFVVLACSAHKESYRRVLREGVSDFRVVYLEVPPDVLRERMLARQAHFMPVSLLPSQLAIMERPAEGLILDGTRPPEELIALAEAYVRSARKFAQ